jgi:hypothetical protein
MTPKRGSNKVDERKKKSKIKNQNMHWVLIRSNYVISLVMLGAKLKDAA